MQAPQESQSPRRVEGEVLVYTMDDLEQQTARVLGEIERTGKPAFITKHGHYIATITPLAPGQTEADDAALP